MKTGDKIRNLREQAGYTLEELGKRVGVGKSTVRKWETGMIENMGRDKIEKLADVFGVSPNYLIKEDEELSTKQIRNPLGYQFFAAPKEKEPTDLSSGELNKRVRKLSPEFLTMLTRFLDLAEDNPESAERFLSFAVQELESLKRSQ